MHGTCFKIKSYGPLSYEASGIIHFPIIFSRWDNCGVKKFGSSLIFKACLHIVESDYQLCHVCMPVCLSVYPHAASQLPLDGLSQNLMFEYFWKICQENSNLIKIWQEWLCMKISVHLWQCLAEFFLERHIFLIKM